MPALNRNEKVKCEECGQEYRRSDNARHRKRCEKQEEHKCSKCHFYTKNKEEMNYHVAKKHIPASCKQSMGCSSCEQEFPSYYSLQQHRRKKHGAKQRKPSDTVADLNKIVEDEGEDGEKLKEELGACQNFLVDTEMEYGEVFNKLDSAAKINIALGFVLRNNETGKYRYFYAHENNTLFEKSHLLCTKADLITIQGKVEKFDIVEQCTQER